MALQHSCIRLSAVQLIRLCLLPPLSKRPAIACLLDLSAAAAIQPEQCVAQVAEEAAGAVAAAQAQAKSHWSHLKRSVHLAAALKCESSAAHEWALAFARVAEAKAAEALEAKAAEALSGEQTKQCVVIAVSSEQW